MISYLLAQADSLSGGAGWLGAGLLGAVLGWLLLKHLPEKDRQLTEFQDSKDKQIQTLTEKYEKKLDSIAAAFERENKETRTEFKQALTTILTHCEQEIGKVAMAIREELRFLRQDKE